VKIQDRLSKETRAGLMILYKINVQDILDVLQSVLDKDNVVKDNGLNKYIWNPMGHRTTDRRNVRSARMHGCSATISRATEQLWPATHAKDCFRHSQRQLLLVQRVANHERGPNIGCCPLGLRILQLA
jgi:hypothetical protein